MIKRILVLSSLLILVGCASADESLIYQTTDAANEDPESTVNSQSLSSTEDMEEGIELQVEDEQENQDTEVAVEAMRPWEEFDDINEFMSIYQEEKHFTVADAAELEDEVENAFREELPEDSYKITGRWSGFIFSFIDQMEDEFSDEYINKLVELNDTINSVRYEGSIEEVQQLVQEAREIRESE